MNEIHVIGSDLPWEPAPGYPAGTRRKVLRKGKSPEPLTALLALPAGFEMEAHSHLHTEHHYVLEGAYETGERRYPAGSYRLIPGGRSHGPFRSESGAVVLLIRES